MARHLKIAAAQLGPIQLADSRSAATTRLVNLLREAHGMGAKFVVFPEMALTTFFPRWWFEDQAEVDRKFYEWSMPSADTQRLFDEAKRLGVGFYLGYAELVREPGSTRRFNTSILVSPEGTIVGKYRKIHLPGHSDHKPKAAFQHLELPAAGFLARGDRVLHQHLHERGRGLGTRAQVDDEAMVHGGVRDQGLAGVTSAPTRSTISL